MSFEALDEILKTSPVVELREEAENRVLKADFCGHLQLVSVSERVQVPCNTTESMESGKAEECKDVTPLLHLSNDNSQVPLGPQEESTNVIPNQGSMQLISKPNKSRKNRSCTKNGNGKYQACSWRFDCCYPEIHEYSSSTARKQQSNKSKHSKSKDFTVNEDLVLLTQAEKKRLYRMKMKEEKPALWSAIKEKEAMRKRELREQRRRILHEMQSALEVTSLLPDSPEYSDQQMYLEALKERYPDIWNQLLKAIPETEERNESLLYENNTKNTSRGAPKPARMYKDVIEAQKKRLYRQRLKEERPEMYERQKAREAIAKSQQRLLMKNVESSIMGYYTERQFSDDEKMYDSQLNAPPEIKSEYMPVNSKDDHSYGCCVLSKEITSSTSSSFTPTPNPTTVSEDSQNNNFHTCDHEYVKNNYPSPNNVLPNIYTEPNKVTSTTELSTASSTQSNMLWYWNDVKAEPNSDDVYDFRDPQELTREQRLEKIDREKMCLKERRRQYRLAMTPERRARFLETERERVKRHRIKKKGG